MIRKKLIKNLKSSLQELGYELREESWYDEEAVEVTSLYSKSGEMIMSAHGWGDECTMFEDDSVLKLIIKVFKRLP